MTFGSRGKGSRAEIEVAKLHENWWGQLEPGCLFVRTPSSGGWSGPQVRAEFRAGGDLMTTAQRFPFCVEIKRREKWSWATLLAGKPSPIWDWWEQTVIAAAEMQGLPILWFRKSREPWHVLLAASFATSVIPGPSLRFGDRPKNEQCTTFQHRGVHLMPARWLLEVHPGWLVTEGIGSEHGGEDGKREEGFKAT